MSAYSVGNPTPALLAQPEGTHMKSARLSLIALAITTASIGAACAADTATPRTRDQVRAELVDAQRNGTLIADAQTGATFRDLYPGRYMQPQAAAGLSRAQVLAELQQARALGLLVDGATGQRARDLYPHRFPAQAGMQADTAMTMGQTQRATTMY
jgi:hypothetical protein